MRSSFSAAPHSYGPHAMEDESLLAEVCHALESFDDLIDAAGPARPLGQILVDAGKLAQATVRSTLERQRAQGGRIGELLIDQGAVTSRELDTALEVQAHLRSRLPSPHGPSRLGEILVRKGLVSRAQVAAAVEFQSTCGLRLGDALVRLGYLSALDVQLGLRLQSRLAALALATAMAICLVPRPSEAGSLVAPGATTHATASTSLDFAVHIPLFMRVGAPATQPLLRVSDADVQQGYVDVELPDPLRVTTNSPDGFSVHVGSSFDVVDQVDVVEANGQTAALSPRAPDATLHFARQLSEVTVALHYRFHLSRAAVPGVYAWPITLSAAPSG